MNFIAIVVCLDNETSKFKYINKEFINHKSYYPENNSDDISELLNSLSNDEDFKLYNITPIDICEIVDKNGNCLWGEEEK